MRSCDALSPWAHIVWCVPSCFCCTMIASLVHGFRIIFFLKKREEKHTYLQLFPLFYPGWQPQFLVATFSRPVWVAGDLLLHHQGLCTGQAGREMFPNPGGDGSTGRNCHVLQLTTAAKRWEDDEDDEDDEDVSYKARSGYKELIWSSKKMEKNWVLVLWTYHVAARYPWQYHHLQYLIGCLCQVWYHVTGTCDLREDEAVRRGARSHHLFHVDQRLLRGRWGHRHRSSDEQTHGIQKVADAGWMTSWHQFDWWHVTSDSGWLGKTLVPGELDCAFKLFEELKADGKLDLDEIAARQQWHVISCMSCNHVQQLCRSLSFMHL